MRNPSATTRRTPAQARSPQATQGAPRDAARRQHGRGKKNGHKNGDRNINKAADKDAVGNRGAREKRPRNTARPDSHTRSHNRSPIQTHTRPATHGSPFLKLWGWPIVLGVLTTTGLLSALVSDGWGDAWSWFALGVPVAVMTWLGLRRRPRAKGAGIHPA